MHFSMLFSSGWGTNFSHTGFLIAIAVMACILGAEIAGICILISKLLRARREGAEESRRAESEDRSSSYREYGVGVMLLAGAIPQTTYVTLTVLTVLAAIAAIVFLVLLIVVRVCGYDFASASHRRSEAVRAIEEDPEESRYAEITEDPASEETETVYSSEEVFADASEEQRQYAFTEEDAVPGEDPIATFAEEPDSSEGAAAEMSNAGKNAQQADSHFKRMVGKYKGKLCITSQKQKNY